MFDAKKETNKIINFIRNYYQKNNLKGVVIGISGGKDSAVVAALFVKALGKENVIGLSMPCHSNNKDMLDAKIISDYYGFTLYNIDLTETFDVMKKSFNIKSTKDSDINLKPRLRMATLYYYARALSTRGTYLVAGTGNKCEIFAGYFTKGGDGQSDINVLATYTVSEVIKIGKYLSVPKEILYKVPSDGLSSLSDEDKLGVTYQEIEDYLNGKQIKEKSKIKIEHLHKNSKHKNRVVTLWN